MEIFLSIIIILFLFIEYKNIKEKFEKSDDQLKEIRKELKLLLDSNKELKKQTPPIVNIKTEQPLINKEWGETSRVVFTDIAEKKEVLRTVAIREPIELTTPKQIVKSQIFEKQRMSFFDKNPDLEKFIGENLINKIGISILVLGIAYFVKFAIDKNWINEIGRVLIGVACGSLLIGIAHKLRKTFTAFSSVLIGGGLAILYFTFAIAFHEYHIFSQTVCFGFMVLITIIAIFLSVVYDKIELAILAILGGYGTPFMLSTGEGNYIVLFTYIMILNTGMLALAYLKKWNLINIISYVFTILLFGGWLIKELNNDSLPIKGALVYCSLFYLTFFLMNIINNLKTFRKFEILEISLLLSNTALFYTAGMLILADFDNGKYQGLFTITVALLNMIFTIFLFKSKKVDKNLVFLLIGIVLTFISLAAPVQLKGSYITIFWALEAVLMLWFSQKSGISLIKKSSILLILLMFVSLIMDWQHLYSGSTQNFKILFNKGFITGFMVLLSLVASWFLLAKEKNRELFDGYPTEYFIKGLKVLFTCILYVVLLLELNYQLIQYLGEYSVRAMMLGSYNLMFVSVLSLVLIKSKNEFIDKFIIAINILALLSFLVYYQFQIVGVRSAYLETNVSFWTFMYHLILISLAIVSALILYKTSKQEINQSSIEGKTIIGFIVFLGVFLVSSELDHIVLLNSNLMDNTVSEVLSQNSKIGYPIVWSICSFILMYIGMKKKNKFFRILSLCLFSLILLKLFIVDIRGISEGGKIAAFIFLGVILLVISFMYQKLKKIIFDEESEMIAGTKKK